MQFSFILNQIVDYKTYDEWKKNPTCKATRGIEETDRTEKDNCTFSLAFSTAAFLYAGVSHKST